MRGDRETNEEVTALAESETRAMRPEDLTRLFVERANARDAAALADLYEEGAVVAFPPGQVTTGRDAIRGLYEGMLAHTGRFEPEPSLPALHAGDIALTATRRRDGSGLRVQVVRRQADGSWLRLIDWPEPSDTPS